MNLQPTRDEFHFPCVAVPDLATAYRLTAALVEIEPDCQVAPRNPGDGVSVTVEIEPQKVTGEFMPIDRMIEILTAACAKVNSDAAILARAAEYRAAWNAEARSEPDVKDALQLLVWAACPERKVGR